MLANPSANNRLDEDGNRCVFAVPRPKLALRTTRTAASKNATQGVESNSGGRIRGFRADDSTQSRVQSWPQPPFWFEYKTDFRQSFANYFNAEESCQGGWISAGDWASWAKPRSRYLHHRMGKHVPPRRLIYGPAYLIIPRTFTISMVKHISTPVHLHREKWSKISYLVVCPEAHGRPVLEQDERVRAPTRNLHDLPREEKRVLGGDRHIILPKPIPGQKSNQIESAREIFRLGEGSKMGCKERSSAENGDAKSHEKRSKVVSQLSP